MRKRLVMFTGGVFVLTATAAWAGGIDGTGSVNCPDVGQIKIKPALVNGGTSADSLKIKTKSDSGCTGTGDGANVISAKGKGTGTGTTNDCGALIGPQPSNLTLTVKWKTAKGTPKLNPSTLTITSQTGTVTGTGHGEFDVTGTVTAGSFNGNNVTAQVITDQTAVTDILGACGAKGLKKITFGLKPGSDAALGSGSFNITP